MTFTHTWMKIHLVHSFNFLVRYPTYLRVWDLKPIVLYWSVSRDSFNLSGSLVYHSHRAQPWTAASLLLFASMAWLAHLSTSVVDVLAIHFRDSPFCKWRDHMQTFMKYSLNFSNFYNCFLSFFTSSNFWGHYQKLAHRIHLDELDPNYSCFDVFIVSGTHKCDSKSIDITFISICVDNGCHH